MNIVKQKQDFLNTLLPQVPKQAKKLFCFGYETLVLQRIISLRANARQSSVSWASAKMKIYRLTINRKIFSIFLTLMKQLSLVSNESVVAIDFSDFGNDLQVLMFAVQTKKGRAIPVYFEILRYPIKKGSQNIFIITAIRNFRSKVSCKPVLVFDRGFACPSLINFLAKNKYIFIIRIKKGKRVAGLVQAKDLAVYDSQVTVYGLRLRLIISDRQPEQDPWYLITNDQNSSRNTIIERYYHRFEIEEFFRDTKRVMGLEFVRFEKVDSLATVLWFVILGMWLVWQLEEKMTKVERAEKESFGVSTIRYYFEKFQKEIRQAAECYFSRQFGEEIRV